MSVYCVSLQVASSCRNCTIVGNKRTSNDEQFRQGIFPMLLSQVVKILNKFYTVHEELKHRERLDNPASSCGRIDDTSSASWERRRAGISVNPICIQSQNLQFRVVLVNWFWRGCWFLWHRWNKRVRKIIQITHATMSHLCFNYIYGLLWTPKIEGMIFTSMS